MSHLRCLDLFPDSAHIQGGHLYVGGVDTVELAHEWGTPLYLYDLATIRQRCHAYKSSLAKYYPGGARTAYASKAFLCTAIAQIMEQEGLDLDVVSGGEIYVALQSGFPASRMHYHGNGKTQYELEQALGTDIGRIVIDSFWEMDALSNLAAARGVSARAWLRLSPGIDAHTHRYRKTGLLDSKFGFPISTGDAISAVEKAVRDPHIELVGLHAHIGSQISETEPFVRAVEALIALGAAAQGIGFRLDELSPGGGLAVPYTPSDKATSIEDHVRQICAAVARICKEKRLPLPYLVLEPGRSIIGAAGVALYRVIARKEVPRVRTFVSIDGGLADNPRPALYQATYTALLANRADVTPAEKVAIAGRFCESGDLLVQDIHLPVVESGDLLAVPNSGAYQLSMSSNYNLVPRPAAVMVADGSARPILRRETYQDLIRRDLPFTSQGGYPH